MFFCPICNGRMVPAGRLPIFFPLLAHAHIGLTLTCLGCAMAVEVDPDTGSLQEFPGWRLANLYVPYNGQEMPRSYRTLVPSMMHGGRES